MASSKEANSPAYILSLKWLRSYRKFILNDEFKTGYNES